MGRSAHVFMVVMLIFASSAIASDTHVDNSWQLKRDKQGVKIYTRSVKDSAYKEIKGVTLINTRLSSLVALMRDPQGCAEWEDLCKDSKLYGSISAKEYYVYTLNDLPWPFADRDVLAHVTWQQNPDTLQVSMHSQATKGMLKINKDIIRVTEAHASWVLKPLNDGQIEVTVTAHINPGGSLPGWMTKFFLVDSPYKSLINLKRVVKQPKYAQAKVSFLREPEQSTK